jgi:YVTN family beta-propeller protein
MGVRINTERRRVGLAVATSVVLPAVLLAGCSDAAPADVAGAPTAGTSRAPSPTAEATATAAATTPAKPPVPSERRRFRKAERITGALTPKSVDASTDGFVVAQNMIYTHTVSVFGPDHDLVATIKDEITPSDYGYPQWKKPVRGGPVEASFSPDGAYVWVSNYSTYGPGFTKQGDDVCSPASGYDRSFLYRINTATWEIDGAVLVGSVPKYVQASPDGKTVLVTNWCSYDLSVIDTASMKQVARIPIGRYPRGIAITPDSTRAYVAVMGGGAIKTVDLTAVAAGRRGSKVTSTLVEPGRSPRHLNLSPDAKTLYATLNGEGTIAKINIQTGKVVDTVRTGQAPRSSVLSPDGTALFVVNYESDTVSRVRTRDLAVLESIHVDHHPIGITYNAKTREIWVCSYIGVINVFTDAVRRAG